MDDEGIYPMFPREQETQFSIRRLPGRPLGLAASLKLGPQSLVCWSVKRREREDVLTRWNNPNINISSVPLHVSIFWIV